jgi:multidrug efflux system membrane fusion protein
MNQQHVSDMRAEDEDLGSSFEAQNSQSDARALGSSFELHNSVSAEEREELREKRRPKSHLWIWIAVAVIAAAVIFLVHRTRSKQASGSKGAAGAGAAGAGTSGGRSGRGQQGPAAITVGQAKTGDINIYVDALGTVTPTNTVTIYSQITGRVMAVYYREGQLVHKGDPLVDIDPRPYQATLTQAQGTLAHDKAVLAEAKIDLERYQAAFARNAIAKQQLDDQVQVVFQDQGTVTADEGTVAYDQVQLAYCHIVAPITGKVGLRLVDPGNTVFSGTGSTLVVITQLTPITVVFNVSEDDLPQVQAQLKGGHALSVDAYDRGNDKKLETGRLTSLDNEVDTTTGTVKFRATFANPKSALYPNQFVNARLLVKTLHGATLVPSAAVQHNGTAAFVYVVKPDNTVAVQNITTQTSNEEVTAVQGVNPGTTLATSGFDRLENGAKVQNRGQGSGSGAKASQGNGSKADSGSPSSSGNKAP